MFATDHGTCPNQARLVEGAGEFELSPWPIADTEGRYLVVATAPSAPVRMRFEKLSDPSRATTLEIAAAEIASVRLESFWDDYLPEQEFALLRNEDAAAVIALYGPERQRLYDTAMEVTFGCAQNLTGVENDFSSRLRLWDILHISDDTANCNELELSIAAGGQDNSLTVPVVDAVEAMELAKPLDFAGNQERLCLRATAGGRAILGLAFAASFNGASLSRAVGGDNCFWAPSRGGETEIIVSAGGHSQALMLPAP